MIVKALSLRQPYANLVASGLKTLETRTWTTSYRGDIMICSSGSGRIDPRGVTMCMVELVAIRPMVAADAEAACIELYPGAYAWELTNLRPVRRHPMKGRLQIYNLEVPDDVLNLA